MYFDVGIEEIESIEMELKVLRMKIRVFMFVILCFINLRISWVNIWSVWWKVECKIIYVWYGYIHAKVSWATFIWG
jgi:hypothetical protein